MSAEASSSSTSIPPTSNATAPSADDELEKLLSREASVFQREVEVERILKAFKLKYGHIFYIYTFIHTLLSSPYDIFDIRESATAEEIKKKYKQISLFIHPDKCPHARAPEAFDLLKKAESELSDKAKREELDAVINQARTLVLKALELPTSTPDSDPELKNLNPSFHVRLKAQSKELLIEEELRRRKAIKMNLANEGLEAKKKEEEVAAKKRKAEEDKVWEGLCAIFVAA
ncbi:hypothetical protein AX15_002015 [Amanita polypyramis BW_CC]|nr:hypothetical protein AX15_002015 [Amanita polypyramis BW_CC]